MGILGPMLGQFWGCQGLSWAMLKLLLATFGAINQLHVGAFVGLFWGFEGLSCAMLVETYFYRTSGHCFAAELRKDFKKVSIEQSAVEQAAEPALHPSAAAQPEPVQSAAASSAGNANGPASDLPAPPEEGLPLTGLFLGDLESQAVVPATELGPMKVKDRFLSCDLVVPGIALKKLAMCLGLGEDVSKTYFAVLARDTTKSYKIEKPSLRGMVIGDIDKDNFWGKAIKHLHGRCVGAVMAFKDSTKPVQEDSWANMRL